MVKCKIEITIIEGRQLKNCDKNDENDAFVEVFVNESDIRSTQVVDNSNSPEWGERFIFDVDESHKVVQFNVYDKDAVGRDLIGEAKLKLKHLYESGFVDQWIKLSASMFQLRANGEIHIAARLLVTHVFACAYD